MRRFLFSFLLAPFLVAISPVAHAASPDWSIVQMSGQVYIKSSSVQPASLAPGGKLAGGDTLATRNGRVLLVRNRESMVVGPNTVVTLPTANDSLSTTVILGTGQVEFEVEKRNVKHFAVETPLLAAVVKGTHFTVTIAQRSGKVQVSRGRVEVTDLRTGQMVDVLPGQKAVVDWRGLTISGYGELSDIVQGVPRAPLLGPLLGDVTAGLGNAVNGATGLLGDLLGGSTGINAGVGGSGGVSASVGGGVSVSVGGLSVSLGGGLLP